MEEKEDLILKAFVALLIVVAFGVAATLFALTVTLMSLIGVGQTAQTLQGLSQAFIVGEWVILTVAVAMLIVLLTLVEVLLRGALHKARRGGNQVT